MDGDRQGRPSITPARVLWVLLAVIAFVLVAQNSNDTEIEMFWWTIQAPLFVVILASMLIGWGLGTLGIQAWSWRRRRHIDRHEKHDESTKD
jgi:uncharacterized integral membrane protein